MADPIAMLEQDHRKVETLFEEYKTSKDPLVVEQICTELTVHAEIEEQVIYPVVGRELPDGKDLRKEAEGEHQEVKDAIAAIEQAGYDAPEVEQHMQAIIEGVTHHVQEEESEMFPQFRENIGEDKLTKLGEELTQAKQKAMQQVAGGSAVEGELTKEELYQKAKEQDIEGRSKMNKEELQEAVEQQ